MTFSVLGITGSLYGLAAGGQRAVLSGRGMILLNRKTRFSADAILFYGVLGMPIGLIVSRAVFCCTPNIQLLHPDPGAARQNAQLLGRRLLHVRGCCLGLIIAALITAKITEARFPGVPGRHAVLPLGVLIFGLRLAEGLTDGFWESAAQVEAGALVTQSLLAPVRERRNSER